MTIRLCLTAWTGPIREKDNLHDHTMDAVRYFAVSLLATREKKVKIAARVRGLGI